MTKLTSRDFAIMSIAAISIADIAFRQSLEIATYAVPALLAYVGVTKALRGKLG